MKLSLSQKNAVEHLEGPALVLAVPGAGKTTVLINRTYNLIVNHKIAPDRILSITFSKASALDMQKRFLNNFPKYPYTNINFSTIHSFCFSLIRDYASKNRITYKLIEEDKESLNKYTLLKKIYYDLNGEYINEEKLDSLLNHIGYIKNMLLSVDEFMDQVNVDISNFKEIFSMYEGYKKENNLIDFDDMLSISLDILKRNPSILNAYRRQYDFLQVDEGQDTSKIQMEIIKLLAFPKNNIFIVADDDQSIYGFRGAYPQGLLVFNKVFPRGKVFFMEENFRSSKNIVSISNKFIAQNQIRYMKNIFTNNPVDEPVNIIKVSNIREQYNYILRDIRSRDSLDVCILYRNNLSSIGLIDFLDRNNIPFYVRDKKLRFFNHWIIKDILYIMKLSQNTCSMDIYENIYYKIRGFISKKQVLYAKNLNCNQCVFDRILDFPGLNDFYKRTLRELKHDFKKLSQLSPKDAIVFIEHNLEYDSYLKENSSKFGFTYENLKSILYHLKIISESCRDFQELVDRLKYIKSLGFNSAKDNEAITLSTIHSAKGLEFKYVYILDLVDGEFPSFSTIESLDRGDMESYEEERRLFYVGMTRAKKNLSLIAPLSMDRPSKPSVFLRELEDVISKK